MTITRVTGYSGIQRRRVRHAVNEDEKTASLNVNLEKRGPIEFPVNSPKQFGRLWVFAAGITWTHGKGGKGQYQQESPEMTWEEFAKLWKEQKESPARQI